MPEANTEKIFKGILENNKFKKKKYLKTKKVALFQNREIHNCITMLASLKENLIESNQMYVKAIQRIFL